MNEAKNKSNKTNVTKKSDPAKKTDAPKKAVALKKTAAAKKYSHVLPPLFLNRMGSKYFQSNHCFVSEETYLKSGTDQKKTPGTITGASGKVFILGKFDSKRILKLINEFSLHPYKATLKTELSLGKEFFSIHSKNGPVWILAKKAQAEHVSHWGLLEESFYSWHRDRLGSIFTSAKNSKLKAIEVKFENVDDEAIVGSFVGIESAAYNYKQTMTKRFFENFPVLKISGIDRKKESELITMGAAIGHSLNLSRHLVNLPPNHLNPHSMEEIVRERFTGVPNFEIDVWQEEKLKSENMGLLLGVGQGATHAPRLIHLRYRPSTDSKSTDSKAGDTKAGAAKNGGASKEQPIAFVGKGITFDTGGLDIKPSSGMRLMKKDMGGSATILGVALWTAITQPSHGFDFYLSMAENSIDKKAFRPSDVLLSRNGLTVEIHNTDAEGRLALADALDVAVSQKGEDEPQCVIDVATLTGAIKTALGTEIAGMFCNDDKLAEDIQSAGADAGDYNWRMPLYNKYTGSFPSSFADMVNAVDGWGGPITAALFLEKFIKQKPWVHLDVYCWNDRAESGLSFAGGNGQAMQCLVSYIRSRC